MNEEIEYAEMLEIPVSTVNVVRKNHRRKKQKYVEELSSAPEAESLPPAPLKDSVIAQVNDRLSEEPQETELPQGPLSEEGRLDFDPIPDRIDTVRLYSTDETESFFDERLKRQDYVLNDENDGGMYALKSKNRIANGLRIALGVEFAAACALCGAIFLTNVFMPNSAINTFFRAISSVTPAAAADTRTYQDFTLSSVVSELSDAELTLSPAGILSFTDACCVYSAADGTISEITQNADGSYLVKLTYSDTFSGVINGLDQLYYTVGDEVKCNVPLGYTDGEGEVQVTMYSSGTLLNCFQLTEENCLAWVSAQE